MFVITLTYTKPLDEVEHLMPEHMAWVDRHYDAGVILTSGRSVPRTGGVILAAGVDRDRLDAILAEDPFTAVADYTVAEFAPTRTAPGLEGLLARE
jgi:uncharacterized protein YciI